MFLKFGFHVSGSNISILGALIYGTLNWHYRDRRRDRVTDQIVRDRYEHNLT